MQLVCALCPRYHGLCLAASLRRFLCKFVCAHEPAGYLQYFAAFHEILALCYVAPTPALSPGPDGRPGSARGVAAPLAPTPAVVSMSDIFDKYQVGSLRWKKWITGRQSCKAERQSLW